MVIGGSADAQMGHSLYTMSLADRLSPKHIPETLADRRSNRASIESGLPRARYLFPRQPDYQALGAKYATVSQSSPNGVRMPPGREHCLSLEENAGKLVKRFSGLQHVFWAFAMELLQTKDLSTILFGAETASC